MVIICVVSFIGDFYNEKIPKEYPWATSITYTNDANVPNVTREEFDALKKDVQEMKSLLIKAKLYDEENGEKDCEMVEKVELLKKIAELVGVDLGEVFQ